MPTAGLQLATLTPCNPDPCASYRMITVGSRKFYALKTIWRERVSRISPTTHVPKKKYKRNRWNKNEIERNGDLFRFYFILFHLCHFYFISMSCASYIPFISLSIARQICRGNRLCGPMRHLGSCVMFWAAEADAGGVDPRRWHISGCVNVYNAGGGPGRDGGPAKMK